MSMSPDPSEAETSEISAPPPAAEKPRKKMSGLSRFLFFLVAWLIVLLPFFFWRSTWFGRTLSDSELAQYFAENDKPRHIQHALVQVGERIARGDRSAQRWYPDLVRLAIHPVEEVRTTDAWVMGQDTTRPEFHAALRQMLGDSSPMVRGNAALSLVRFGDDAGHAQIVELLQPVVVTAPRAGKIVALARAGEPANHGTMLARIEAGGESAEVRAPITGRVRSRAAKEGDQVAAGAVLLTLDPGTEQVWEALRALYLVGRAEDLPLIESYQRPQPDLPQRIQQQAAETAQVLRQRRQRLEQCATLPLEALKQPFPQFSLDHGPGERYQGAPSYSYDVSEAGTVENIQVNRSSGLKKLDQNGLETIAGWRFKPRPGCGTVSSQIAFTIDFR
jgi:TonB family protein